MIGSKLEYKISWIVDLKIDCRHTYKLLYKVIWLEYKNTKKESDWLSVFKLVHIPKLISGFYQAYPNKSGLFLLS